MTGGRSRRLAGMVCGLAAALCLLLDHPVGAQQSPVVPVEVEAEELLYDAAAGGYVARGAVVLRRAGATLWADEVHFDAAAGTAHAQGHVVLVEGDRVLSCRRLLVGVEDLAGAVAAGTLTIKSGIAADVLARLERDAAVAAGRNALTFTADNLERTATGEYRLQGGSFTPCDCGEEPPSWKLSAYRAAVKPGERAWLALPVFHIQEVPVFALPALYLPLSSRRSGFLMPQVGYRDRLGLTLSESLFLTLGPSYDTTLEYTWLAERGHQSGLEFRYAPRPGIGGTLHLEMVADQWEREGQQALWRWAATGRHQARWGEGWAHRLTLDLLGDGAYQRDFGAELTVREQAYLRTDTVLSRRFTNAQVSLWGVYYQDLAGGRRDRSTFAAEAPPVLHRLPGLSLDLLPGAWQLGEQTLLGDLHLGMVHDDDLRGRSRTRMELRPALAWPIDLAGRAVITPSAFGRIHLEPEGTAWTLLGGGGLDLETELFRLFPLDDGAYRVLRHGIRPRLSYRWIGPVGGQGASEVVDEVDALAAAHQVRLLVGSDLWGRPRGSGGARRLVAVEVGQGLRLDRLDQGFTAALADLEARTAFSFGRVTLAGSMAYHLPEAAVADGRLRIATARRGNSLWAEYAYVSLTPGDAQYRGVEELVAGDAILPEFLPDELLDGDEPRVHALHFGGRWAATGRLALRYGGRYDLIHGRFLEQTAGLAYSSGCACWGVDLLARWRFDRQDAWLPDIFFLLDLANLGSLGNR